MKKVFKITFFITLALTLIFGALFVSSLVSFLSNNSASTGIIGGADGPTTILVSRTLTMNNPVFWLFCISSDLLLASAIGWFVLRKQK